MVDIQRLTLKFKIEKIATLKTVDYLEERAKRGSREHALDVLNSISDKEPFKEDRL